MLPQLGVGGCTPTPKKLSADSSSMLRPTASVIDTTIEAVAAGGDGDGELDRGMRADAGTVKASIRNRRSGWAWGSKRAAMDGHVARGPSSMP